MISEWTDNFNQEKKIGEGAFGSVFSCVVVFPDEIEGLQEKGRRVAVKKVNAEGIMASLALNGDDGGVPNNFLEAIKREINVLSSFHHQNIIRLVAYCLPPTQELKNSEQRMKELCLVYELAPLGGLNALLKNDSKASMMLWQHRLNIAVGAAKGLCCMHNNIPDRPAYHRDIKAANIAIMDDYTAKIIDCGLSKYMPETSMEGLSLQSSGSSRYGTLGYMCPLYSKSSKMKYNARCEIFSFGILLLELTTGLLQGYADENGNQIFLEDLINDEESPLSADRRIKWPDGCVKKLLSIAEQCVASYQKRFQNMVTVMSELVSISKEFYRPTHIEEDLIKDNSALKAKLQALELKDEVRNLLKREATYVCQICFDREVPASKGGFCSNLDHPHFFCGAAHNDCFSDMVLSQASDQSAFDRNDTSIVCAYCIALVPRARSSFDLSLIGKQANGKALGAFVNAGKDVVHAKGVVAQEKQQLEHRDEIQKLKEEHIDDKAMKMKVQINYLYLVEKIKMSKKRNEMSNLL